MSAVNPCDPVDERAAAGIDATGREAFLVDGRIVRVLGQVGSHYIVEPGYEEDGELFFDNAIIVSKVFAQAPVEAFHARVTALQAEEVRLRDSLRALRSEVSEAEAVHRQRIEKLKKLPDLARLEQFIAGEITHYVLDRYSGVEIIPFPHARSVSESKDVWNGETYEKPLRMLQLFGDPKRRQVEWRLSAYSDGSDGHRGDVCYPCLSLDEARAKATELFLAKMAELLKKTGYMHGGNYLIESAKKLDIQLPEEFTSRWNAHEAQSRAERITKLEQELALVRAEACGAA